MHSSAQECSKPPCNRRPPPRFRHGCQSSLPRLSKEHFLTTAQARVMSTSKRDSNQSSNGLEDAYEGFEDVGLAEDTKAGPSRHDSVDPWSPSEASTHSQQRSSISTGYTSLASPYDQPWASKEDDYGSPAAYPPARPSAFAPPVSTGSSTTTTPMQSCQPKPTDEIILGVAVVDFNHLVRREIILSS